MRVSTDQEQATPLTVTIHITEKPRNTFVPTHAFGAGIDGSEEGTADRVLRPTVVKEMRSIGFRALTYRLRTELAIESWHWNPKGTWSDPKHRQGYWTSDGRAASGPISVGWGYRLPRRGSTVDQANDDGYSRLDDGDARTFWKSNPYLDQHFTGESNAKHPQWFMVDLGEMRPVDTIRLRWAAPYATRYRVDYLRADKPRDDQEFDITFAESSAWVPFPEGNVTNGKGGDAVLRLATKPIQTRFVRVWMTESSRTLCPGAAKNDIRDRLGYAIREVSVGTQQPASHLQDWVQHGRDNRHQSAIVASSCDPWHRATDRDPSVEQPGFDRIVVSGLHSGQPILLPASLVYDTPENTVTELQYLHARGIPIEGIELGEEPDGQYILPEDYAALYAQWAKAIRTVDPKVRLGGPSFQTAVEGWIHWPDATGDRSWMRRFLNHLKAHGRLSDFQFFSFEWYPFDELWHPAEEQLRKHPAMLDTALQQLRDEGLPDNIPWIISEYGWSPFATRDEVDLPGALVNAETVARFLTLGGDVAYLYGWEPGTLHKEPTMEGATYGNLLAFLSDDDGNVRYRLPAYWAGRLIASAWADDAHRTQTHAIYAAEVTGPDGKTSPDVLAYAIKRPDARWSILLVNRDPRQSYSVRVQLQGPETGNETKALAAPLSVWRYGRAQYEWHEDGMNGHPTRSLPPEHIMLPNPDPVTVPPFSLTVIQGR